MPVKSPTNHRQRQAQETQRLIVNAAVALFLDVGYGVTSIEAIAQKAGVAVSTIYAAFGNKRGILKAIRETWHQTSQIRETLERASEEPDPARRLELVAHTTRRQWEAGAVMMAIYLSAAAVDAEAAAEHKGSLAGRRTNVGRAVERWSSGFRPDLEPKRAVAIFLALTQAQVYLELVREFNWTPDEYESWLAATLKQQLL